MGLGKSNGSHPGGLREANWFHAIRFLTLVCSQGSSLPIEANSLWKYFCGIEDGFGSTPIELKICSGSHFTDRREADWFHKSRNLAALCPQGSTLPIEAKCLWKYFHIVEDGFGSTLSGLKICIGSHTRGWRETNWFHKSWILAAVCSQCSTLPIEANCLWKYLNGVEIGFENTPKGLKIGLEVFPRVDDRQSHSWL